MKKNHQILIILLLISIISFGQSNKESVNLKWGPEESESKKAELAEIFGSDESGFYIIKQSSSKKQLAIIEQYDINMTKKRECSIPNNKDHQNMKYEFTLNLDCSFYIFSSTPNKKIKKNQLFVQTIKKNTLTSNNDIRLIAEIDYSNNKGWNASDFNYKFSSDSSKVLIFYDLPYKKGEPKKIGFHIFDNLINGIWSKETALPNFKNFTYLNDYILDNKGNVYILAKVYENQEKRERVNHNFKIIAYKYKEEDFTIYNINSEGKFLSDMKITIGNDNNIICVGLYSKRYTSSTDGCYFFKIDNNSMEMITKSFTEFNADFFQKFIFNWDIDKLNTKLKVEKFDEIFKLIFRDIIFKKDGGFIIIAESFYKEKESTNTTTANTGSYSRYYTNYKYLDIIALNMSSNGELIWNKGIEKFQVTSDDKGIYSSFSLSSSSDKLYFIFNDNIDNLNKKKKNTKYGYTGNNKNSYVALVIMDMDGYQKRKSLFTYKETGIIFKPNLCKQISNNQILIYGKKKEEIQICTNHNELKTNNN